MGRIPGAGRQTCGYQRGDISWFPGAVEEGEIPGAQPPSRTWGWGAASGYPQFCWRPKPLLGKSLGLILTPSCSRWDLKLEGVLQPWLWAQSSEEGICMCVSLCLCILC